MRGPTEGSLEKLSIKFWMCLGSILFFVVSVDTSEADLFGIESKLDASQRTVSMFGDDDLGNILFLF